MDSDSFRPAESVAYNAAGMRKITSYFPIISKDKIISLINKHCFTDCLCCLTAYDRADKVAEPMLSCDFCEDLFHLSCCRLDSKDIENTN